MRCRPTASCRFDQVCIVRKTASQAQQLSASARKGTSSKPLVCRMVVTCPSTRQGRSCGHWNSWTSQIRSRSKRSSTSCASHRWPSNICKTPSRIHRERTEFGAPCLRGKSPGEASNTHLSSQSGTLERNEMQLSASGQAGQASALSKRDSLGARWVRGPETEPKSLHFCPFPFSQGSSSLDGAWASAARPMTFCKEAQST